jgi:hypothetical protein
MKKLFIGLFAISSMAAYADSFQMHCIGASVEREGNFAYAPKEEIFSKTINLEDETTVVFITDGKTMNSYLGEEIGELRYRKDLKNKTSLLLSRNFDENDQPTNEMALFTGKVINENIQDVENDILNNSVNLFSGDTVTSIDIEKGIMLHCQKL